MAEHAQQGTGGPTGAARDFRAAILSPYEARRRISGGAANDNPLPLVRRIKRVLVLAVLASVAAAAAQYLL